ncbi:hypothetical protein [Streptomyces sp. cg36]|uniref:hypothetical protein n=1 Tax=Streptomyces sp. cg36 TaxID=3238798 RepID=UPI0034E1DCA0
MRTDPRIRHALNCLATTAALAVTLGAEGSGCSSSSSSGTSDKGVTYSGNVLLGRYTQRISEPYVTSGRITGYADAVCRAAVLRHELTVILNKRTASGTWAEQNRAAYQAAPGINVTKKATVTIGCVPGFYRTRLTASVDMLSDKNGGDSGQAHTSGVAVNKEQRT